MKRIFGLLLTLLILCGCLFSIASADEELLKKVYCDEQGFSVIIPADKSAYFEEDLGLRVSVEEPGYVPYLAVYRREAKLNDPVNFLNNVYREYMENQYNNNVGTNPCKEVEIGGKTLYSANYHYEVNGNKLVVTKMIEVRDDGDVEYLAKYLEGESDESFALLDTVVRYYQTEDGSSAAAGNKASPAPVSQKEILRPLSIAGAKVSTKDDAYWAEVKDTDKLISGGYFTLGLYLTDEYPAAEVNALQPGDRVEVNGDVYTIDKIWFYETGEVEIIPREAFSGDIVFDRDGDTFLVMVDDWIASSFLADYKVMMPLPNDFSYVLMSGGENVVLYDQDSFVQLMIRSYPAPVLSQYNTMVSFSAGLLMNIIHDETIAGPN